MSTSKRKIFPLAIAHNTWTLPYLSLGMVTAYLRSCHETTLKGSYEIGEILLGGLDNHSLEDLYESVQSTPNPVCLFSSYVWNHDLNLRAAQEIKNRCPDSLIIFGGPEVPKYEGDTERFLTENGFIDIAVLGEGEISCAEILAALAEQPATDLSLLAATEGIVFSHGGVHTRTGDRARVKDITLLPSPYLTGEFGDWFYDFSNTILETNRGCPYGCTYCDWGSATLQKVTKFIPERVIAEIEFLASRRSQVIFIADANFGMLEQDIEISRALVAISKRTGYPKKLNTNFAKNGGRRLMAVIKILHEGGLLPTGIIALQTTDEDVLKVIRRDNIKTTTYETMMEYFNAEKIPIATDLMIGLPGQTVESMARDLQYCFDWKVSANGNFTSMMPNAPMAEKSYVEEHNIVTDSEGLIASTATFSKADMRYMRSLFMVYEFHVRLGILKYYLYFLQLEHGVKSITFLQTWMDAVIARDPNLPISVRLFEEVFAMDSRSGDWSLMSWGEEAAFFFEDINSYYDEIIAFTKVRFDVDLEPSVAQTLSKTQGAVTPRMGRSYPFREELEHDINAYFDQLKEAASLMQLSDGVKPLSEFGPGELKVKPKIKFKKSIRFTKISGHMDGWELPSALRFY
ncbi:MAG: radical SAM superfamily enzyme YgiQ (UPF0313 family) [Halioglobus sp.]|jgi:radical SAM superfamily enzyme YgiQ (UPF0313 family)